MFSIEGLDHVALTVRDLSKSVAWYRETLGLERRHAEVWGDYPVLLCAGDSGVALFSNPGAAGGSDGATTTIMRHFAFRITRFDFERARLVFQERGVPFRFEDHGISDSLYINDPDGYEVELTTYEIGGS